MPDVVLVDNLQQDVDRTSFKLATLKQQLGNGSAQDGGNNTAEEMRQNFETLQVTNIFRNLLTSPEISAETTGESEIDRNRVGSETRDVGTKPGTGAKTWHGFERIGQNETGH